SEPIDTLQGRPDHGVRLYADHYRLVYSVSHPDRKSFQQIPKTRTARYDAGSGKSKTASQGKAHRYHDYGRYLGHLCHLIFSRCRCIWHHGLSGDVPESADDSYHWLRRGACRVTDAGCRLGAYVIRQCRFHAAHVVIGGLYSRDYCWYFAQFTDARKTDSQNFRHYLIWARPEFHA